MICTLAFWSVAALIPLVRIGLTLKRVEDAIPSAFDRVKRT